MSAFPIAAFSHAGALSRGDKRRMNWPCAIQHPRLLLLDEPTAGMSRHDTNTTIDLLQKIKARGMTKVIIEHDMHALGRQDSSCRQDHCRGAAR